MSTEFNYTMAHIIPDKGTAWLCDECQSDAVHICNAFVSPNTGTLDIASSEWWCADCEAETRTTLREIEGKK